MTGAHIRILIIIIIKGVFIFNAATCMLCPSYFLNIHNKLAITSPIFFSFLA